MLRSRRALGYGLYLLAATMFAINGTVAKQIILSGVSPTFLSQLRITAAFLLLAAVLAIIRPAALRLPVRQIPILALYGVLGVAMTQWLYFVAIENIPVGLALILEFTAPLFVALWFRFGYREPTRNTVWLGLALALIGLMLVAQIWQGFSLNPIGALAGLGAACALTVYYVLGDAQLRRPNPLEPVALTLWGFAAGAIFWAIVRPWWLFPWSAFTTSTQPVDSSSVSVPVWGLAVWMVVLGTIVPFWLVLVSLRHIRASQASAIGMTEPLIASAIAWAALGEVLSIVQIVGGLVVLFGVLLAERSRISADPPKSEAVLWE